MKGPEEQFLKMVIQCARLFGWRTAHFRPCRTAQGWRTAVQGDGKGWPDLVCIRGGQVIIAELKSETGTLSPEQEAWLAAWRRTGTPTFEWRPSMWDEIERILEDGPS